MINKYTKQDLEEKIDDCEIKVSRDSSLEKYLIEALLELPRSIIDEYIVNATEFIELGKYAQCFPNQQCSQTKAKTERWTVLVTQETLELPVEKAKYILLHETGHICLKHPVLRLNDLEVEKLDREADDFVSKYYPQWHKYFRRENNILVPI